MKGFRALLSYASFQAFESAKYSLEEEESVFEVIGYAKPQELMAVAFEKQPDIIMCELTNGESDHHLAELKKKCPHSFLIAVVDEPYEHNIIDLLKQGINGCIPSNIVHVQLVQAVELIVFGGMTCIPRLGPGFFREKSIHGDQINTHTLTVREREVGTLLCKSLSNQEIAEKLGISESTVKTHLRNIFRKLNVRNRSEALTLMIGYSETTA